MLIYFFFSQSMEKFQQQLADAERAAYGWKRGADEGDRTMRGSRRKNENGSRERSRRNEGDWKEREQRRGNERDASPPDRGRHRAGRKEEKGGHQGRQEERACDGDVFKEKDRDRKGERDNERGRNRERERSRDQDKERDRPSAASSFESHHSSSLVSLKSRFLKPSEDDSEGDFRSKYFLMFSNCTKAAHFLEQQQYLLKFNKGSPLNL